MLVFVSSLLAGGPKAYRLDIYHTEGTNIGVKKGYTSGSLFFSTEVGAIRPFIDLRGHVFNDGKPALNAGFGVRTFSEAAQMVFGGNIYYDYRRTKHLQCNQIGMGFEALGRIFEVRANGYLYVGKNKSSPYEVGFVEFEGHHIILANRFKYSLPGMDVEFGGHITRYKYFNCFLGGGPYYFHPRSGDQAIGGKIRFTANISKYITVEGRASYDPHFHWTGQGMLKLTLPFGPKVREVVSCCEARSFNQRFVQPVVRQEMIPVSSAKKDSVAIDPLTGLPFNVIFVNNTSSSDGTFESPYPVLLTAQNVSNPHDITYLFPGDGTTNNQDAGLIMKDFQKFWGSGTEQTLLTTLGEVNIPALTSTMPVITGATPLFVVSLANNNEVSGLQIITPNTFASIGTNSLIQNLIAKNNTLILGNASAGVATNNFSGNGTVENNTITGDGTAFSVGVLFNGSNDSQMQGTITNNTIDTLATGVLLQGTVPSNVFTIEDNVITNSTNRAILMEPTGSAAMQVVIDGNQILDGTNAVAAIQTLLNTSNSPFTISIFNNTIEGGDTGVLMINQVGNGTFAMSCFSNTITNVGAGIDLEHVPDVGGIMSISINNNSISPSNTAGFPGISLLGNGIANATTLQATIVENSINGFTQGIEMRNIGSNPNNQMDVTISGNNILNYQNNGILLNAINGFSSVVTYNNTVQSTGGALSGMDVENSASVCSIIDNNLLNSPSHGLIINNTGSGTICLELLQNTSNSGFQLNNSGSSFRLEVPSLTSNNPNPTTSGVITNVPAGSCGCIHN